MAVNVIPGHPGMPGMNMYVPEFPGMKKGSGNEFCSVGITQYVHFLALIPNARSAPCVGGSGSSWGEEDLD